MPTNTDKTKVIFRQWRSGPGRGDVIALFPEVPADNHGYHCQSYEHIGQHGGAAPAIVLRRTVPATAANWRPLARELEQIGYVLTVLQRFPTTAASARRDYLRRLDATMEA